MQRLVIAVGELSKGGITGLYIGQDADAALRAIEEAGRAGKITCGFLVRHPPVSRRVSFVRTPAELKGAKTTAAIRAERAQAEADAKALATKAGQAAVDAVKGVIVGAVQPPPAAPASVAPAPIPAAEPGDTSDDNHFGVGRKPGRR